MHPILPTPDECDDTFRATLLTLLRHPVMVEALQIVDRAAMPDAAYLLNLHPAAQASVANQAAGRKDLIARLGRLATPKPENTPDPEIAPDLEGEWGHLETFDQ